MENNKQEAQKKEKDLQELLESNLELNKEIFQMVKYIKRYVFWRKIFRIISIVLILTPIILGLVYLPPFLEKAYNQYNDILGSSTNMPGVSNNNENVDCE